RGHLALAQEAADRDRPRAQTARRLKEDRQLALAEPRQQHAQALRGLRVDVAFRGDPFAAALPACVRLALRQIDYHRIAERRRRGLRLRFRRRGDGSAVLLRGRRSAERKQSNEKNQASAHLTIPSAPAGDARSLLGLLLRL